MTAGPASAQVSLPRASVLAQLRATPRVFAFMGVLVGAAVSLGAKEVARWQYLNEAFQSEWGLGIPAAITAVSVAIVSITVGRFIDRRDPRPFVVLAVVLPVPGRRRVYSNVGIDTVVAAAVAAAGARDAASLLTARVFAPLGMTRTTLVGPAAHGARGPLADLGLLAGELLVPTTLRPEVVAAVAEPAFPGLAGVLPGFGRQEPNDWGLGAEIRGRKSPHWLPDSVPPDTFGHFGQSGSFLWIDRQDGIAGAALTGTAFGPWAAQAWPRTTERMLALWKSEGSGR